MKKIDVASYFTKLRHFALQKSSTSVTVKGSMTEGEKMKVYSVFKKKTYILYIYSNINNKLKF